MSSPRDFRHQLALRTDFDAPQTGGGWAERPGVGGLEARLASAEQTLRDISHALAHDMRTSLRHVVSYAQLLGEPACAAQPDQVARLSAKVLESSRRLQRLMDAVSDLARLRTEDLRTRRVDTSELVWSVAEELGFGTPDAVVALQPFASLPPVMADAGLLRRVWKELLDNAMRHARTAEQPRVEVGSEPVPGGTAYFVHDNGQGFEPEKAQSMFELFQHGARLPSPGEGVGLAMVRRIVECHGGKVWAYNRPGQGASFGFSLPSLAA